METTYYNRSNNFSAPIRKEPKPFTPKTLCAEDELLKQTSDCGKEKGASCLKNSVKNDDLLILALLFLFLSDSNNDTLLLLALLYLLLFSNSK